MLDEALKQRKVTKFARMPTLHNKDDEGKFGKKIRGEWSFLIEI